MAGSILTNILGAFSLTIEDAWEAARLAGLARDIEQLPMGMHTVASEGGSIFVGRAAAEIAHCARHREQAAYPLF